jgi:hypothetical protein
LGVELFVAVVHCVVFLAADNTAYNPFIRNISGADSDTINYGDLFSYDKAPRALIFARNQSMVNTLEDMKKLMRFNNFQVLF